MTDFSLHFSPLIDLSFFSVLAVVSLLILTLSFFVSRRHMLWRTIAAAVFLFYLGGPSLYEEKRESVPDVAVIVADQSPSQSIGDRQAVTDAALDSLTQKLKDIDGIETRVVKAPVQNAADTRETLLFSAVEQAYGDIPESRRAGVILLTDGQVHDVPADVSPFGPVQTLLTGDKNEIDRQLQIIEAPAYGIAGQKVTARFKVIDTGPVANSSATLIVRKNGAEQDVVRVPVGTEQTLDLPIDHGGQNIFELEVAPIDGEITDINNRTALIVNGVRDRLKVLLVSGQPHPGGRTWRNLLTSDPAVDLVHFTILREPQKIDATPQSELSLIAFPFRELFEEKLYDFDLIIFDRYRQNYIMPEFYFNNISKYVSQGGALLIVSGPDFSGKNSIYNTDLNRVLPGRPLGGVVERAYKPGVTPTGLRHPVTENLTPGQAQGKWGNWLRYISTQSLSGDVVMEGPDHQPLLMLDRVGEGRVAQLASDQIWLWARGYDGGGPQGELLRRLAHWLMKEPELEENALRLTSEGNDLHITRRSLTDSAHEVTFTHPDGKQEKVTLTSSDNGALLEAHVAANAPGVYRVSDGEQQAVAMVGDLSAPEFTGMVTTEDKLKPVSDASGGAVKWIGHDKLPDIRLVSKGRRYAGLGWIGLRRNNDYVVTGVQSKPLIPVWPSLILLLAALLWPWRREGKI